MSQNAANARVRDLLRYGQVADPERVARVIRIRLAAVCSNA